MDQQTVHVKDIALGVLVVVLGLFLYYFAWAMINYVPVFDFLVSLVCLWIGRLLLRIGYTFVKGIDVNIS
jgi:hypothetical protein